MKAQLFKSEELLETNLLLLPYNGDTAPGSCLPRSEGLAGKQRLTWEDMNPVSVIGQCHSAASLTGTVDRAIVLAETNVERRGEILYLPAFCASILEYE